jgi:hypothetical protein
VLIQTSPIRMVKMQWTTLSVDICYLLFEIMQCHDFYLTGNFRFVLFSYKQSHRLPDNYVIY